MSAANVDLGNLRLRLNAQAMEIIRLRQMVEERGALNAAQAERIENLVADNEEAERIENLVADNEEEGVQTDYCESCGTSFIKAYGNHRPVVWFKKSVIIPGRSQCNSACASCVSKYDLEGRELAW